MFFWLAMARAHLLLGTLIFFNFFYEFFFAGIRGCGKSMKLQGKAGTLGSL
jgi:hypothetical protein